MFRKTLILAALLATAATFAAPAQAGHLDWRNGPSANGTHLNGGGVNGMSPQGLSVNGRALLNGTVIAIEF